MEANIAYYCLHEFHMLPSEIAALPKADLAFISAAIEIKAEEEKKRKREAERKAKRR